MYKFSLGLCLLLLVFSSCKKNEPFTNAADGPIIDDSRSVLLKDIEAQNLPAPYFHFEYDAFHYVKKISFASQFFIYDVEYQNKRVKKMINEPNQDSLVYKYNNNDQVSSIYEFSGANGKLLFKYQFIYNTTGQLIQSFWYRYSQGVEADLIKRADLTYYVDGNLAFLYLYYAATPGTLALTSKEEFLDYDNKMNVDDITLLKDFFDSYLFLPQVRLQKNNPGRVNITSDVNEYQIANSYQYRNDLPLVKFSLVNQTKGGNGQGPIKVETDFTYY